MMAFQKRYQQRWRNLPIKQKGVTLIVALVVLLVMSVVAIASMSSSTLQARMASNEKQMQIALHAAEAGSRAALLFLADNSTADPYFKFKDKSIGLYSNATKGAISANDTSGASIDGSFADYYNPSSWKNDNSFEVTEDALKLPTTAKNPRYIIEFLGEQKLGGSVDDLGSDSALPKPVYHYRIVSIGWAQDPQVYTIVQTTYKTEESF